MLKHSYTTLLMPLTNPYIRLPYRASNRLYVGYITFTKHSFLLFLLESREYVFYKVLTGTSDRGVRRRYFNYYYRRVEPTGVLAVLRRRTLALVKGQRLVEMGPALTADR